MESSGAGEGDPGQWLCQAAGILFGPCPAVAAGLFRKACVHEHVSEGYLCADHVADARYGLCKECADGPDPHRCQIVLAKIG